MSAKAYDDIEDLIGGADDGPKGPPVVITSVRGGADDNKTGISLDLSDIHAGVSVFWLASVFGMGTETVKRKLADCPPLKKLRNAKLYNLRQAAAYLVEPKVDIDRYIKTLRASDLPPALNKDYWEAQLKRQKWELEAGDLWRTGDVLEVLGDVFKHLRTSTQLWTDTVERTEVLTVTQRDAVVRLVDGLLEEIHARLVEMPSAKKTSSLRGAEGEPDA